MNNFYFCFFFRGQRPRNKIIYFVLFPPSRRRRDGKKFTFYFPLHHFECSFHANVLHALLQNMTFPHVHHFKSCCTVVKHLQQNVFGNKSCVSTHGSSLTKRTSVVKSICPISSSENKITCALAYSNKDGIL